MSVPKACLLELFVVIESKVPVDCVRGQAKYLALNSNI